MPLLNEVGQGIYDKTVKDLKSRGSYEDVDQELLLAYCFEMQDYFTLYRDVQKEGVSVDTGTGSVKSNPKLLRMQVALTNAKQLAYLLGISADGRKRVGATAPKKAKSAAMNLLKLAK